MHNCFIFSSVGSNLSHNYKIQVFESWQIKDYDSGCVVFSDTDCFDYSQYFNNVLFRKHFKFPNLFYFLSHNPEIVKQYKYIAVLDDDLLFNQHNTIYQAINYMDVYNLSISSISNGCQEKKSPYYVMNNKGLINELWITNFVEMGFMIIDSKSISNLANTSDKELVEDYGYDYYICNIANKNNLKIGVFKNLDYTNPQQPNRQNGWTTYQKNKHNNFLSPIQPLIVEKILL